MTPKKLKISGFGPYPKAVEIDFEKFGKSGVFLITGDTGAGKSTIFDAISYALYDEPSAGKKQRKEKTFRSDYSGPTDETYVIYEFSHKGRDYRIKRNPEYYRADKKSKTPGKLAKETASALFEDLTTGAIVTDKDAVTKAVKELIGLDRNQFSQTVMIAQGDFRKILTASSEERKTLFKKIFGTALYGDIQEKLKAINTQRSDQCKQTKAVIESEYARIEAWGDIELPSPEHSEKVLEALAEILRLQQSEHSKIKEEEKSLAQRQRELDKAITEGNSINKLILNLQQTCKKLEELSNSAEEYAQLEVRIEKAECASEVQLLHSAYLLKLKEYEKNEKELAEASHQLSHLTKLLSAQEKKLEMIRGMLPEAEEMKERSKKLSKATELVESYRRSALQYKNESEFMKKAVDNERRLREYAVNLRNRFYLGQAGILATELSEGEKCPVCGSQTHPEPAILPEDFPTEAQINKAEADAEKASSAVNRANSNLAGLQKTLELLGKELEECGIAPDADADEIRKEIAELTQKSTEITNACEIGQKAIMKTSNERAGAEKSVSDGEKRKEILAQELDIAESRYHTVGKEKGFESEEDYLSALMENSALRALKNKLAVYNESKASAQASVETLEKQIDGREPVVVDELVKEYECVGEKLDDVREKNRQLTGKIEKNLSAEKNLTELYKKKNAQDHSWSISNDVYSAVSGHTANDSIRLSFEAYIQQYYFKRVIASANVRLNTLTEGKFTLRCRNSSADKRQQGGLDLEVLDGATGQWRDVSTLSGGETFMASLALALGLADTVQAGSGGVRLDSMFIDEGFGTLDENVLRLTMDMLSKLADGKRLVGIISHVAQLKSRIDKKIIVTKSNNGSSLEIQT
ncbi:MAG: SMC family ATPase [Ruminococcus sp.]|nr:SMC family ATPase [Ruminococcus sp.]